MLDKEIVIVNKAVNPNADFTAIIDIDFGSEVSHCPTTITVEPGITRRAGQRLLRGPKVLTVSVPCYGENDPIASTFAARVQYALGDHVLSFLRENCDAEEMAYALVQLYGSLYFIDMPSEKHYVNPSLVSVLPAETALARFTEIIETSSNVVTDICKKCAFDRRCLTFPTVLDYAYTKGLHTQADILRALADMAQKHECAEIIDVVNVITKQQEG